MRAAAPRSPKVRWVAVGSVAVLLAWPVPVRGTERPGVDPLGPFLGTWAYVDSPADRRGWSDGIDRAVEGLPPLIREIARGQIRRSLSPERRVAFASPGEQRVRIALDGWSSPSMPTTGAHVRARGPDGADTSLAVALTDEHLVLRSTTDQGTRETFFSVSPEGGYLFMQVRVTSDRLTESVRYTLTYRRLLPPP